MVAVTLVFLVAACFMIVGGFLGFSYGYDKGWDTAMECLEEEIRDVQGNNDF